MHIALTTQQEQLRRETQAYFEALMTPERRAALTFVGGEFRDGDAYLATIRQLGRDGWLGLGWPQEFGGQNRSMVEQLIFNDAAAVAGVPIPYLTINTIGPTLMRYGTEAQKEFFLPKILRGELHFAVGYSEPDAGTDLAALRTTARLDGALDGGSFVVSGQKMWTSQIKYADWVWLAVRTDSELPRHKGLSIVMVPTDADGFSTSPVDTVAGLRTSATFFDQVRVPTGNLVGELNGGWPLITNQLNHERVALFSAAALQQHIREVTRWARETRRPDGRRVADDEWVRNLLGVAHARTEMLSLMNWKLATTIDTLGPAEASATKIFGSENALEVYRMLMEIVGPDAGLTPDSAGAVLAGRLERYHRSHLVLTFGGGTNEIQRDMIGYQALGLPAARR